MPINTAVQITTEGQFSYSDHPSQSYGQPPAKGGMGGLQGGHQGNHEVP